MNATSPDGVPIVSIIETVPCTVGIEDDSFIRDAKGVIHFEYDSNGAQMDWNEQTPTLTRGKRQFLDDLGRPWSEDEIVLVDEED